MLALLLSIVLQLAVLTPTGGKRCTGTATYEITFNIAWENDLTAPLFPPAQSIAFTIWAASDRRFNFLKKGAIASDIVRDICSTGIPNYQDMLTAQRRGMVGDFGRSATEGQIIFNVGRDRIDVRATLDADHTYLWLANMIFPSPDWCSAPLRPWNGCDTQTGRWRTPSTFTQKAYAWDAGTDSQVGFVGASAATAENPRKPMRARLPINSPSRGVFMFGEYRITFVGSRLVRPMMRLPRNKKAAPKGPQEIESAEDETVSGVVAADTTSTAVYVGAAGVMILGFGGGLLFQKIRYQKTDYDLV